MTDAVVAEDISVEIPDGVGYWKQKADDLARLIQKANAPIFGIDTKGNVSEWNEKTEAITGYTKGEAIGKPLVQTFIQPENWRSVQDVLSKGLKGEDTDSYELPLLSKSGKQYMVLLNASTCRDHSGRITGVVGLGQDISELKEVIAESKRQAEDLVRLIETANAPILGIDTKGKVTEWNAMACRLLGFAKEEAIGKDLVDTFITQEFRQSVNEVLSLALMGKETANFEIALFTKSGERKEVLINAATRRGPNNEVTGVIGVGQEITQIRDITREQSRVADDLSRLIDSANAPIFGVDCDGLVTEWNRKAAEILGYVKAETIGKNLVENFIQPENRNSVSEVLAKALAGEQTDNYELNLVSKFGECYTVLLNATTRRDARGKTIGVVGVGQDITALNRLMAESKRVADDLTRLIETANAPIFGVDTQGRVTEWNQKLAELSEFTKKETFGQTLVANFITEEYHGPVSFVLLKALHGEETASFELPLVKNGAKKAVLLLNATTRRGPDGEVIGVICVGQDITQINAMTADQQRIADDLSRVIDTANAPIFGVDTKGMVTEWNRKAVQILGYTKEETIGKHLVNTFIQPEDRKSVNDVLQNALDSKETANYELPLLSKHGQRFTILLNATTRTNASGRITGVVGVGQDITELNQVMAEQKRVADDLTRLIETANAPIFGIDAAGNVCEWNAKASSLSGFNKSEAIGRNLVQTFITDDFKESVDQVLSSALLGRETANFEFPLFTKFGERRDILLNATTRRGPAGEVTGVIGVGQDITQIREVTDAQERIADDLQRLIETANAPIFGVDTNGMVTEWNRKAAELLGYTKAETVGKKFVERFIQQENQSLVADVLQKALSGQETANFSLPLIAKRGQRYTVLLNATTRRDAKGDVTGVVGVGQDITELNQVMAESERVADDLMRLIETANAPIFGIDNEGKVTEWNAKASGLLEFTKQETMGRSLVENFITEEFKDSVNTVLQAALQGKETANFEFPLFTKSGQRKDILLNATTRRGSNGEVTGVIGVGQDITQIREITSEQMRVAEDLSRLIESANAPIFGVDLKGCVTEWNRKAADMLGYTKQDTLGKNFVQNFIQLEDRESTQRVLQRAFLGEETANYEMPLISQHGKRYTVLLNATPRRDGKGNVTGVVGVGQDITELEKVMRESKHVADDLTRLIETANAPIFGIDRDGNISEWNRKTAAITGFSKTDALGKSLVNTFIHEDHRNSVDNVLKQALLGEESSNYELPLFTKGGDQRDILLNATARRDAAGDIIGVVGVGQDITEFKKASERAQRIAGDLTRLIETANAPIFGIDTQGKVNEWNAKATEVSGYSKAETMGKHLVNTFIHLEFRFSVSEVLQNALMGKEVANFELPLFTKGGQRREILLNATPRRGDDGSVIGVLGVGQDITELNQQRTEALRIADDLGRIIETANAPIFGVDIHGRVTEWNLKLAELSQFSKEYAMGKSLVTNFITESLQASVGHVLLKALNGEHTPSFELPLVKDGEQKAVLLLNATTRRGPDREAIGVICVGQDITQINAMAAEQQRIADDLARFIDTANAPIFGVDPNGLVTEWNRNAADLLGFPKEEAIGRHMVQDFIEPENRASVEEMLRKALAGSETANYALPLLSKRGKRYTILLNATTRRDAKGQIIGVVGVGQDITKLNEAMADSKLIADDLTRLIETANAPIFGIDTEGKVTEWNAKASSLLGFSKEETIGKNLVSNFITEEFKNSVGHVLDAALSGNETANFEFPLFTKNGARKEILLNATTRRGPNGEVTGVIGVGQDITRIREITSEQQRNADDLARLIDTANAPIFGVDLNGLVTEWNRKAADMLGYGKEETLGKAFVQNFIQPEDRTSVGEVLLQASTGNETANYTLPLMSKLGKRYTVLLNATTRRDAKGKITGVVGVGQDITELNLVMAESNRVADDLMRLIETANAPIFGIDTQGKVSEWNAKASSLLGFTKSETMGKSLVGNFITEEFKSSVDAVLRAALMGKETANFEFPLFTKEGERKAILLNATTRRGPDGEVTGVIGVGQDITEIRDITSEHERIADDLSRLIETANAPIFGVDLSGMVTEWNRKAADMLGYTKAETMGKIFVENFIQPENRRSVERVLNRAMAGEEAANFELPLFSKSQRRLTVLLNATTRRDAKGAAIGVVGVGQDITELNQLMGESKRIADDLTRLIETANAPIFGINTAGEVTEWNRMVANITEYSKEEALGKNLVNNFINEQYKDSVSKVLEKALGGQETANFEFPLFTKHLDRKIQILMSAAPRRGPDGQVIGMIGVGQDITDLRAAKETADRTADELARLIDSANAPIFGVDQHCHVTEWNQKMSRISGVTREEAFGTRIRDWLFDADATHSIEAVLRDALNGKETANFELRFQSRDNAGKQGAGVVLLLSATARLDSTGAITGVVSIGQDITEHKSLEQRKMRFMAVVSHELRSPIHGINGLSDTMAASEKDPARQRKLKMITNCSTRLLDLVSNIMDISSMRTKTLKLNVESCHVTQIMEETVHLLQHATDKQGRPVKRPTVKLVNDLERAKLPSIEADVHRCTQVFYNLVMNALKFTQQGEVRITGNLVAAQDEVEIHVTDTGIGISQTHLERVFEPFEQEDDSEARTFEGIGLGLSISREVVVRHGGRIKVRSEVGKGSTFTVTLPTKFTDRMLPEKTSAETLLQAPPAQVEAKASEPRDRGSFSSNPEPSQRRGIPQAAQPKSTPIAAPATIAPEQDQSCILAKATQPTVMPDSKSVIAKATLPSSISDRFLSGEASVAQDIPMLSVLTCGVADWQQVIHLLNVTQIIQLLTDLVTAFDNVDDQKVFKFRSTDCGFMVVSGHDGDAFHAKRLLGLALQMVEVVQGIPLPHPALKLKLRFSLHSGPAMAGVVDARIPRYSVFGDVVQHAQIMESWTPPGCITFSDAAQGQIGHSLSKMLTGSRLMDPCEVQVGDYGGMQLHIVVPPGMLNEDIQLPTRPSHQTCVQPPSATKLAANSNALQVARAPPMEIDATLAQVGPPSGGWRMLSVDDDEVNQEVIHCIFKPEGMNMTIAMNGQQCLKEIENGTFQIVLLDSMMPGMSGLEVCKHIRKRFTPLQLPIIMLTCRTAAEEAGEAIDAGCNDYVRKPFTRVELVARVHMQLAIMQERQSLDARIQQEEAIIARSPPGGPLQSIQEDPSPSPTSSVSALQTLLSQRSELALAEMAGLRTALREQERVARTTRGELAACRAKLATVEAEADEVWQRLSDSEKVISDEKYHQELNATHEFCSALGSPP